MSKQIAAAVLWGLASMTWASMAHVLFGIPDLGAVFGLSVAAGILLRAALGARQSHELAVHLRSSNGQRSELR